LIVGPMSRSAVATLVERRSKLLRLVHVPGGHRSEQLATALTVALADMDRGRLLTLTWDQGSEMARHDEIATLFSEGVFFADPGCPWMRGTNENTNGLIVSTYARALTFARTPLPTWPSSKRSSTPGHARASGGRRQIRSSPWQAERVNVATVARIQVRTQAASRGQYWLSVDKQVDDHGSGRRADQLRALQTSRATPTGRL
jgi:hypothetical protein